MNDKVACMCRQGIANVAIAGSKTSDLWVFNPASTRAKNSFYVLPITCGYFRLPIGPCNSLILRFLCHS